MPGKGGNTRWNGPHHGCLETNLGMRERWCKNSSRNFEINADPSEEGHLREESLAIEVEVHLYFELINAKAFWALVAL